MIAKTRRNIERHTLVLLALLAVCCWGCKALPEAEGYRVVGYDATTHHWTIIRNGAFDGKYLTKRITAVCSSYTWGDHETNRGPEACHLQVGRMMIPNLHSGTFLNVYELPNEALSIVEGEGADRVMQLFSILKYEVVP